MQATAVCVIIAVFVVTGAGWPEAAGGTEAGASPGAGAAGLGR